MTDIEHHLFTKQTSTLILHEFYLSVYLIIYTPLPPHNLAAMASKPSFPAALLRTYTSILGRRTSQVQFHASRLLGVELQSQSQNTFSTHFEAVTRGIERMSRGGQLQAIPIRVQSQAGFGQRRWHSTDFQKSKALQFEDVHFSLCYTCTPFIELIATGPRHPRNSL
jgi:hypothetical protein